MGRPRFLDPVRTGTRRRDFIKRAGASSLGAVGAAQLLPGAVRAAEPASVFQHAVANGDPLADRVTLWTRVTPATAKASIAVGWVVASDPALTRVVLRGSTKTHPARDNTVKVDAIGLQPATTCYYQFSAEGMTSPVGRKRTLPSGTAKSLRMAVVSCSNHDFTLATPGSVTLWTDSWKSGLNVDPELSLFDASFALIALGDDTPDPATLLPGQGDYDSQIRLASLAAGLYHLTLTASGNDPLGTTFAAGFSLAGTTPIPIALWNQPSHDINRNDQKGTAWQTHLDGVTSVSAVPEPESWALLGAGLGACFLLARRRRTTSPDPR